MHLLVRCSCAERAALVGIACFFASLPFWEPAAHMAVAPSLTDVLSKRPGLLGVLSADVYSELSQSRTGPEWDSQLARLILRKKVWAVRQKWHLLGSYTVEQTEAALAKFELPPKIAAASGLEERAGWTWLDAVRRLQETCANESPLELWRRVEQHPMVQYVPFQCQACGHQLPDAYPAPEDANLSEEQPMAAEEPYVRAGWFRGPRDAVVFVYRCPACGSKSRWFRSSHPEVTLNPNRWGRLCGEQEDLKAWLAHYLGVRLRACLPLDWDHVWTEAWDGAEWQPLDPNCINFARRLNEGIGSWTGVLAIGTPGSGPDGGQQASEDATQAYLVRAQGSDDETAAWLSQIQAARDDITGKLTQSKTLCGHALQMAALEPKEITAELRAAQRAFDTGVDFWDLSSLS